MYIYFLAEAPQNPAEKIAAQVTAYTVIFGAIAAVLGPLLLSSLTVKGLTERAKEIDRLLEPAVLNALPEGEKAIYQDALEVRRDRLLQKAIQLAAVPLMVVIPIGVISVLPLACWAWWVSVNEIPFWGHFVGFFASLSAVILIMFGLAFAYRRRDEKDLRRKREAKKEGN